MRVKESDFNQQSLRPQDFAITDRRYGRTAAIDRCEACGFLQCSDAADVLQYYAELDDAAYDAGREQRAVQARRLLGIVQRHRRHGSLLDIGAGSGILVEEALRAGFEAEGIEPSRHLVSEAHSRGLPVHQGILPDANRGRQSFDVVTLVDVIEHVPDPIDLLRQARSVMAEGGIGLVVTPDVGSLPARLLRWRWWHFRVAHICYFDHRTLAASLEKAGLRAVAFGRPRWYFTGDYLGERLASYFPAPISRARFEWAKGITIPLNLRDSMYALFTTNPSPAPQRS